MSCSLCRDVMLSICDRCENVWRCRGKLCAACKIIQRDQFGSDHVSHTDLEILAISTGMKPSDLILVQWALHSSWCRTTPRLM